MKEDTITIVLRKHLGGRRFVRAEVRGYDEGSRFSVLFRLEQASGPIRSMFIDSKSICYFDIQAVMA